LKQHLIDHTIERGERILLKTDNSTRGHDAFHETWTALSSEAAQYLAEQGVALVGIDWFGIKQKGAPDNGAHTALLSQHIPILEGITLKDVQPGQYTLVAFPIAYKGVDGAQTRAVLIR
jgi:arylformamidase